MAIETLQDVVSELADRYGIYGAPERCEWEANLKERIREAIRIEQAIERGLAVNESASLPEGKT